MLSSHWNLVIKDGSKKIVVATGGEDDEDLGDEWILEDASDVLGRFVSGNNSIRMSWDHVKTKMWKSFFANVRCRYWTKLGVNRRLRILARAIKPLLTFHCAAWPPQSQIAQEMDRLQRRMTSAAIGLRPIPLETPAQFRRRVGREASRFIDQQWWSHSWFNSVISWHEHLFRDWNVQRKFFEDAISPELLSSSFAWAPVIVQHWGMHWVEQHSVYSENNARSVQVSRLFRRACAGHVHARWAEAVEWVKARMRQ